MTLEIGSWWEDPEMDLFIVESTDITLIRGDEVHVVATGTLFDICGNVLVDETTNHFITNRKTGEVWGKEYRMTRCAVVNEWASSHRLKVLDNQQQGTNQKPEGNLILFVGGSLDGQRHVINEDSPSIHGRNKGEQYHLFRIRGERNVFKVFTLTSMSPDDVLALILERYAGVSEPTEPVLEFTNRQPR